MIKKFKIFEAVYIGKIDLKDYNLIYDPTTGSAWLKLTDKSDETYEMEIKSIGLPEDGRTTEMRIFSPQNFKFDLDDLIKKLLYIFNKNRLGYDFSLIETVNPPYGLLPYSIIKVLPSFEDMQYLERTIASTKSINNMVKKDGDIDQFTF